MLSRCEMDFDAYVKVICVLCKSAHVRVPVHRCSVPESAPSYRIRSTYNPASSCRVCLNVVKLSQKRKRQPKNPAGSDCRKSASQPAPGAGGPGTRWQSRVNQPMGSCYSSYSSRRIRCSVFPRHLPPLQLWPASVDAGSFLTGVGGGIRLAVSSRLFLGNGLLHCRHGCV